MTFGSQKRGVAWVDSTQNNGQAIRYFAPADLIGSGPLPLVIWSHPSSQNQLINPSYFAYPIAHACVQEGWILAASAMHSENWGSDAGLADLLDLYTTMNAAFGVSKVILAGGSMGGVPSALAAAGQTVTIPNLKGVLTIDGVLNLANQYANSGYTALIDAAYGIVRGTLSAATTAGSTSIPTTAAFPTVGTQLVIGNGTANQEIVTTTAASTGSVVAVTATTKSHASGEQVSDYPTKTVGHDPALKSASAFGSTPFRFYASANDTTVNKAQNTDLFAAKVAATATEAGVVAHLDTHLKPPGVQPPDIVAFIKRCMARA